MTAAVAERTLVGRERELSLLEARLERVREEGAALVVRGETGVGKSALLEAARSNALARGMATLTTAGAPSEAHVAFAGLHQLLRPQLGALERLPGPQRAAVQAAFGLTDAAAPDFFLIALGVLDLLSEMAAATPLLLVIEDTQWLDAATSDVLTFVSRRLEAEPIVALFAACDGFPAHIDHAGLPELHLAPLDDVASEAVLDADAPDLAPDVRQRVLAEAAGNALALIELPRAIASGVDPSPAAPLPLTERLQRAFAARVSGLPAAARTLLLVAALDDEGDLRAITAAASLLEGRGVGTAELSAAAALGAVAFEENALRFRHPLVRLAVYQGALPPARQAAHAALADAYDADPDRSVWHRAASLAGPDEDVAAALEEAAERARRRGAPGVAATALERAAELTIDERRRGRLLVDAADVNDNLGQTDTAARLLRKALQLERSQDARTLLLYRLEAIEQDAWSGTARIRAVVGLVEQLRIAGETDRARHTLTLIGLRCWWGNLDQETRELVVETAERLELPVNNPALLGVVAQADPVNRGAMIAARLAATPAAGVTDPRDAFYLSAAAHAIWACEAVPGYAGVAIDGFRAQGQLGLLAAALVNQAWAGVHLANARIATPAAEEAVRLAQEARQPRWAVAGSLALATMAAERGETATTEALACAAERVLLPTGANPILALVQFARGRAAIAEARLADAYREFRRIFDPADVAHHTYVRMWAVADLVDTAIHGGGDVAEARRSLDELETCATTTGSSFLHAQLAFARPLLARDDEAESLFKSGLAGELQHWPCYRGRMQLAYGTWLRRKRRISDARAPLRAADETFSGIGFLTLAERARQELRATGEAPRRRTPGAWAQLTPQELQIAQMAATGLTNREIGQKLYLSHRTVGYHLHRIFPKLGITSRTQLHAAVTSAPSSSG